MSQRTGVVVRTAAQCTTPFEVVAGLRQTTMAGPFLISFVIDDIMRRTVGQRPADIILAPSVRPLIDLEYADDVVIFAESNTKLRSGNGQFCIEGGCDYRLCLREKAYRANFILLCE
ncbi:hypothetical protein RB195_007162 [Necator americanus]